MEDVAIGLFDLAIAVPSLAVILGFLMLAIPSRPNHTAHAGKMARAA